ncbi:hypothetical protein NLM27_16400 [Bradyrhizobium sp. CCGB12]|uniref:hypothetical protein n=1 Tax=Bradyrhizobium sp. CCGB12 TaxID=2949632 RepID=UPI0020B44F63|nr:hypothetical protein [Bradyrhizobium sp. CCGB12]MCP3390361.1 hypothetical protein [Bradyrhizobium sp. CCGB12]
MLIARRADTRARADFATWKMMAKLNGASALPPEAQEFLASYKNLLAQMSEGEATEVTIGAIYKAYYAEMGGAGTPPDVRPRPSEPAADNVTAFRRPAPKPKKAVSFGPAAFAGTQKRPLPVALIFACLVVVYVGIRLYWR